MVVYPGKRGTESETSYSVRHLTPPSLFHLTQFNFCIHLSSLLPDLTPFGSSHSFSVTLNTLMSEFVVYVDSGKWWNRIVTLTKLYVIKWGLIFCELNFGLVCKVIITNCLKSDIALIMKIIFSIILFWENFFKWKSQIEFPRISVLKRASKNFHKSPYWITRILN